MSISYLSLLLVLSAAWMGNGLPTEPKEAISRDSRQMMFPIGVVPLQQPSNFFDYVQNLHPAVKHRLLEALVTATTALPENPPLSPFVTGYKAGTRPNNLNSLNLDSNASDEEIFQKISHLLPYSLEELRDMQSRLEIDEVVTIIIQALLGQLVNLVIAGGLPFIISIITGMIAG
ncbi:uncharacterized protein LOC116916784 isoform X2 [Daphnia magna]|uniref:uncharacterized protein LOC116916784 isoform X2 n=1 Tax=Daphnia magna TaxID=35525 RepID=UPI001E1BC99F|nr:uncharacterized protein LOC116916784 isoform X2 [Daphnia magna]